MLTELQKKTAMAIVNIFESGKPLGDYGSVTVIKGNSGHLTYGRSQTTLASGNLALLMHAYCEADGEYSGQLKHYLKAFDRREISLDGNETVKSLLKLAGSDPVMQRVQDEFFERSYLNPAVTHAGRLGIATALGVTILYDSHIHGSFSLIRDKTIAEHGSVAALGEKSWCRAYVDTRHHWLANHSNSLLHQTTYRMDLLRQLIAGEKWALQLPLKIRCCVIDDRLFDLNYHQVVVASAEHPKQRVMFYTYPLMRGNDVRRLQEQLGIRVDGAFGKPTDAAVRAYQQANGLKADGKVGPVTSSALDL